MERISVRIQEDVLADIEAEADDQSVSRSEHIRDLLSTREHTAAHEAQIEELEVTIADLKQENERLHRERRQLLEQREEHSELVHFAQEERSLAQIREEREERREQREERRRRVSIIRRGWWRVFGEPLLPDETTEDN